LLGMDGWVQMRFIVKPEVKKTRPSGRRHCRPLLQVSKRETCLISTTTRSWQKASQPALQPPPPQLSSGPEVLTSTNPLDDFAFIYGSTHSCARCSITHGDTSHTTIPVHFERRSRVQRTRCGDETARRPPRHTVRGEEGARVTSHQALGRALWAPVTILFWQRALSRMKLHKSVPKFCS